MNRISCSRVVGLAAALALSLGAAACDSQGCGGEEMEEAKNNAPQITCGAGTYLQGGQCVATQGVSTR